MVTVKNENGISTILLEGRIDSANAPAIEAEIFADLDTGYDKTVVDAEQLEFISSAGLRVILKLRKACADLKIIGISPDVYEVLEMTGFPEMIQVTKAYR